MEEKRKNIENLSEVQIRAEATVVLTDDFVLVEVGRLIESQYVWCYVRAIKFLNKDEMAYFQGRTLLLLPSTKGLANFNKKLPQLDRRAESIRIVEGFKVTDLAEWLALDCLQSAIDLLYLFTKQLKKVNEALLADYRVEFEHFVKFLAEFRLSHKDYSLYDAPVDIPTIKKRYWKVFELLKYRLELLENITSEKESLIFWLRYLKNRFSKIKSAEMPPQKAEFEVQVQVIEEDRNSINVPF
jgi:hypothetical protein